MYPRKSHVWSRSRAGETGKVQSRDSASANAASPTRCPARTRWAFTLSRDLKRYIHPLWIMPRFPVRWRASRIQYLRPLSSYSRCSGLERQRAHRDRYWGAWVVLFILVPVLLFCAKVPVTGVYDIYFRLAFPARTCIRDRVTLHVYSRYNSVECTNLSFLHSVSYTTYIYSLSHTFFSRLILHVNRKIINLKITCLTHVYIYI